ncbi:MAG: DEAD/DEAH box helicase family protein [Candidatus Omnitrophica bacterium]|nr:DEAD/DEAH box helicase family protein [Candidatus Omnitrophota bacterium]
MLTDLDLKAVYDSTEHDLVKDLIIPLLENSFRYDRGVGFFSSGWLKMACEGINKFAENAGKARIIMSPIISENDWQAIKMGNKAKQDDVLYKVLLNSVVNLEKSLQENPLNALAWLIADDIMKIKFAIPKGRLEGGDFHDKFAIFEDINGNKVAIHGSYNDTIHASLNGESFSVFKSWDTGQVEYVESHDKRFLSIWGNKNDLFHIYDIPSAIRDKIIRYRSKERPYMLHSSKKETKDKSATILSKKEELKIELRDYQKEAIRKWKETNYTGILEMATGTGKTITALACASEVYESNGSLALIVIVPYIHLIDQWQKEMQKFNFFPVLCSSGHGDWYSNLQLKIQDYNLGFRKIFCCITTHITASKDRFQNLISQISRKPRMAIYDEVHSLGATVLRNALSANIEHRLGLSATPQRWFDSHGTKLLMKYFKGTCFSFSLEQAIGKFLVPYKYIPHIIEMSDDEFYEYCKLSMSINKLFYKEQNVEDNPYLQTLMRERAKLINNAEKKREIFKLVVEEELKQSKNLGQPFLHALFYCPIGGHQEVLKTVARMGIKAREFIYQVNNKERQNILKQFERGDIQALVAMKCLDEGIDLPATKFAIILASTTNPREFIQRRGRILRKFEGKSRAIIHDFVVVPPFSKFNSEENEDNVKSILKREMPRFAEFTSAAENEFDARAIIRPILEKFHVVYMLDMKPWDIYSDCPTNYLDNVSDQEA